MSQMTFEERKQECVNRGIVPGAVVRGLSGMRVFIVPPYDKWMDRRDGAVHVDDGALYSQHLGRYAEAITSPQQDLVDRVKELEEALKGVIDLAYSSRLDEAIDEAETILNKHNP